MAGRDSKAKKVEAPEEFPDEAWEEPGEDGLTRQQFAARLSAKREQAAQDAGWVTTPQPDAEVETEEQPVQPPVTDEPPPAAEPETVEEEGEEEEGVAEEEAEEEAAEEPSEGEPEEEGEEPEAEYYAGRYLTKDATEDGLREKDATINRLYRELHEQRQEIEQALQEREAGPQQLDTEAWNAWAEEAVSNGLGADGALAALSQGGQEGYNLYLGHWLNDEDERATALAFNNEVMLSFAEQRAAMQAESFREQRSPTEEAEVAKQRMAAARPDFNDYTETMDRLVEEPGLLPDETKQWLADLARSGLDGKTRAWDYLYLAAVALGTPNRRKAQAEERRQRKVSSDNAKVQAIVSSAEATPTRTPLTEAELTEIRYKNRLRERWDLPLLTEE
jgi:hypothetical protein